MEKLITAKNQPVMIDTCILMVGVERGNSDPNYSFDAMNACYLEALFNYFQEIKLHEMVWEELDDRRHEMIQPLIGKNVEIVNEGDLYGKDPVYTTIFNNIADHELFNFRREQSKNRGDKSQCEPAIRQNLIPPTFNQFLESL